MNTTQNKRLARGTKYPEVKDLQPGARTVKLFAQDNNITVAYVYIKHSRGQADYQIVNYQGVNWIHQ